MARIARNSGTTDDSSLIMGDEVLPASLASYRELHPGVGMDRHTLIGADREPLV